MKTIRYIISVLALTLATASSVFGQAVFYDFNTLGQLTNNFGMRSQGTPANGAIWIEATNGGVNGTGALNNGRATTDYETLTPIQEPFYWPTNFGATLNVSVMFKGQTNTSGAGNNLTVMQVGFISGTNGAADGNTPLNWLNLRVSLTNSTVAAAGTNYFFEGGVYITTNLGVAYMYSNYLTGLAPFASESWKTNWFTNWYQLNATFARSSVTNITISGTFYDMGPLGVSSPALLMTFSPKIVTNLFSFGTTAYAYVKPNDAYGVDVVDNIAAWMTNGPATFVQPPTDQTVTAYRPATFKALMDGNPPFTYKWFTNGVAVTGGTSYKLTLPQPVAGWNGMSVQVAVTNSLGGSVSTPATLYVNADTAAPVFVSAGSAEGQNFGLAFDELLNPTTAATVANYKINGVTPASATLLPDGQRVKLTLTTPITGSFTVVASNIKDLAGNTLASASNTGTVMGLTVADIAAPLTPGSSLSFNTGDWDVLSSDGWDFWSVADQGHAALAPKTGDFDVAVRVASITRYVNSSVFTGRDETAEAAIMARESWTPGARMAVTVARPADFGMPAGANTVYGGQRPTYQAAAVQIGANQAQLVQGGYYPNTWLRLRRVNNTMTCYWWTNSIISTNWVQIGQFTFNPPLTDTMLVGLAANSHYDAFNWPVSAQFRSYQDFSYIGAAVSIVSNIPTVLTSAPNTTVSIPINAAITVAPIQEIQYLWQRGNGLGGFTNIPFQATGSGANNTYVSPVLFPYDSGSQFRTIVKGPGGLSVTSSICTVVVQDTNPPTVITVSAPMVGSNALSLIFYMNLDQASAANAANYTVVNALGQSIGITSVLVDQYSATNFTRVTLFTSSPITNAMDYDISVVNVKATNGVAIIPTTARASFGTIKLELFDNITYNSVGITNAIYTNKVIANFPDVVAYTNKFGFGWREDGTSVNSWWGDNYMGRVSGYFVPPSNGVYRFYIHADDYSRLNLNPYGPDAAGKIEICENVVSIMSFWQTTNYNSGVSVGYALQAGVPYYMEGLWREVTGGDHFAMAFREAADPTVPGNSEVADGRFFLPVPLFSPNPALPNPLAYVSTYWAGGPAWLTNATVPVNSPVVSNFANLYIPVHGGMATLQFYTNIAGTNITDLTSNAKYIANLPDVMLVTNMFGFGTNLTASPVPAAYGARIYGYFVAPTNGFYRFYLKGDDAAQLFMNTNGTDPAGRIQIAYTNQYTVNSYASNGLSVSGPISLTNGQWYYLEGLWKQGTGGDGFAVTWRSFNDAVSAAASTIVPVAGEVITFTNLAPMFNTLSLSTGVMKDQTGTNTIWANGVMGIGQMPVRVDIYNGISDLPTLKASPKFLANTPDAVVYTNNFGYDTNLTGTVWPSNFYSAKVSAYFSAPTTALYQFYIKADDTAELYMSTNFFTGFDPSQKVLIASTANYTANRYTNFGSVMSNPIWLTNGQYYYMEALFSQSTNVGGFAMTFVPFKDLAATTYAPMAIPFALDVASGWFFRPVAPLYPNYVPAYLSSGSMVLHTPQTPPFYIEIYTNITTGGGVTDTYNGPKFRAGLPDFMFPAPTVSFHNSGIPGGGSAHVSSTFPGDNYGCHAVALFAPPTNGMYKFFMKSDDGTQLYMNTNGPDASGKQLLINNGGNTATYTGSGSTYSLYTSNRYFVEFFHKEGTGGDGWEVTWTGGNTPTNTDVGMSAYLVPIPSAPPSYGSIVVVPPASLSENSTVYFFITNIAGSYPMSYQWKMDGVPIGGSNWVNYTRVVTPADSGAHVISCLVENAYGQVEKVVNVNWAVVADVSPLIVASVIGNANENEVLVTYNKNALPVTATNLANYNIPGLTIYQAWAKSGTVVSLLTSPMTAGQAYLLNIAGVRDTTFSTNLIAPTTFSFTAWKLSRGLVNVYRYDNNAAGITQIIGAYSQMGYINNAPDQTLFSTSFSYNMSGAAFGTAADNYVAKVFGWFICPSNGVYRFYVRQDDMSRLYMNTNAANSTDPAGMSVIAQSDAANLNYGDNTYGQAVSAGITLVSNQMYYMEAQLKEGTGNDGVSVAMREAADPSVPPAGEAIGAYFFAYWGNPDTIVAFNIASQPQSITIPANTTGYLTVVASNVPAGNISYQWQKYDAVGGAFKDVAANVIPSAYTAFYGEYFTNVGAFLYRAIVSMPGAMLTSAVATVTVTPGAPSGEPTPASIAGASCTTNGTTVTVFFSEKITLLSATNVANYTISNNLGTAFPVGAATLQSDLKTVILTVTNSPLPQGINVNLTNYTVTAKNIVDVDDNSTTTATSYVFYVPDGKSRFDMYYLTTSSIPWPFYTNAPGLTGVLTNNLWYGSTSGYTAQTNIDNYVARMYGYFIPPSNGLYRFFVACDDGVEFWINTNAASSMSPTGLALIAVQSSSGLGFANPWWPLGNSAFMKLSAGQPYYFETRMREGGGGDYMAVAFRESLDPSLPVYATTTCIPLSFISGPAGLTIPSMNVPSVQTTTATPITIAPTVIGVPATYFWYTNGGSAWFFVGNTPVGTNLNNPLGTNTSLMISNVAAYANVTFALIASNAFSTASNGFIFAPATDTTPPTVTGIAGDASGTNILVSFSELVNVGSATTLANYAVLDSLSNPITLTRAVLGADGRSVVLQTGAKLTPGASYGVTVSGVQDTAFVPNTISTATLSFLEQVLSPGFLQVDFYTNIFVANVTTLTNDPRYLANQPSLRTTIGSFDFHTTNLPFAGQSNYGAKVYGWFNPPTTANYQFYLRGDDTYQFNINTNGADPAGKITYSSVGTGNAYQAKVQGASNTLAIITTNVTTIPCVTNVVTTNYVITNYLVCNGPGDCGMTNYSTTNTVSTTNYTCTAGTATFYATNFVYNIPDGNGGPGDYTVSADPTMPFVTVVINSPAYATNYTTNFFLVTPYTPLSLALTNGNWYYVEALFVQGLGQEYLQATFRTTNAATPPSPGGGVAGWPAGYYASAEVADGAYFGVYGNPDATGLSFAFTQTPSSQTVALGQPLTLTAAATATTAAFGSKSPIYYQWQFDSGAGVFTNALALGNFIADIGMRGNMSSFTYSYYYSTTARVIAMIPGGFAITSAPISLTLSGDQFVASTVGSVDGTNVTVIFSKPVDPTSAVNPANYTFGDGVSYTAPTAGTVLADGLSVVFKLASGTKVLPMLGPISVTPLSVWDVRSTMTASATAVTGTSWGAGYVNDIGTLPGTVDPLFRGSYAIAGNGFDVKAGGSDIWNSTNAMYFVGRQVTGDFDVRVHVIGLTNKSRVISDANAKAALIATVDTNSYSRFIDMIASSGVYPGSPIAGSDSYQFIYRDTPAAAAVNPSSQAGVLFPNVWLRLVRRGTIFYGYRSTDGISWALQTSRDTLINGGSFGAFPENIWIGFGTTSHNNGSGGSATEAGSSITAMYRDIYLVQPPTLTSSPASIATNVGSTISFTISASNPANSGALWYRWRKNGVTIPGANGPTLTLANVNLSDAGSILGMVGNDGGGVSATATLTLNNLPPVVTPEVGNTFAQGSLNTVTTALLGNDVDPEHQTLSVLSVSGVYPITWSNSFDAGLPAGTAIYGNAYITNANQGVAGSGCLALTDGTNSLAGAFVINNLAPGKSIGAFFAQFQAFVGNGSANPADGWSFNMGSDLPLAASGAAEEGLGTGLSINFDDYDSGGGEAPAIEIKWGGQILARTMVAKMTNANYVPVAINLYSDGKVDVSYNNVVIYYRYQTPAQPIKNALFGLYARTGGQFEAHWFDNLSITAYTMETANGAQVTLSPVGQVQLNVGNDCGSDSFWYVVSDPQMATVLDEMTFNGVALNPSAPTIANATNRIFYTNSLPVPLPDFTLPVNGLVISDSCRLAGVAQAPAAGLAISDATPVAVTVWATNGNNQVTTKTFNFTVANYMPPLITVQPISLIVTQGSAFTLNVSSLGDGLGYVWYRSGFSVGFNQSSYTVANAAYTDNGTYWVVITNQYGSAVSASVVVSVVPGSLTYLDFNTAGQLNNNFRVNQPNGALDGLVEMPLGGVGGSRCLDIATGIFDATAVLNQPMRFSQQYDTIGMSVMVKFKVPTTNAPMLELGLVDSTNSSLAFVQGQAWISAHTEIVNAAPLAVPPATGITLNHRAKLKNASLTNTYTASSTYNLIPGRWYKLTAVFENYTVIGTNAYRVHAGIQDMGNNGLTPGPMITTIGPAYGTNADMCNAATVYPAFRVGDASGVDLVDNFVLYGSGVPPIVPVQPQPAFVLAGQRATFVVGADQGPQINGMQWYSNGIALAGATNFYFTTAPLAPAANASLYWCQLTNQFGVNYSGGAFAYVTADPTVPALLSASAMGGYNVGVRFSKAINFAAEGTPGNYTITVGGSPVTINSVTPQINGTNVAIALASPIPTGSSFTVTVRNMTDYSGNAIPNGTAVVGTSYGYSGMDIGAPAAAGSIFTSKDGEWDVTASGTDIWGTSDVGYFVLGPQTGDFDIRVRVASIDAPPMTKFLEQINMPTASTYELLKIGMNARDSVGAAARDVQVVYEPSVSYHSNYYVGVNRTESSYRPTGGTATSISQGSYFAGGPQFPNGWLRMRRVNDTFTTFTGTNGIDWLMHGQVVQTNFANVAQVGLAACMHSPGAYLCSATFRDYGTVTYPVAPVLNIVSDIPATLNLFDGQSASMTFNVTITGAAKYDLQYVWQRFDATYNVWTNIPGVAAVLANYVTPPVANFYDNMAQYRCIAKAPGVSVTSRICTIYVTDIIAPTLVRASVPTGSTNVILASFSEAIYPDVLIDPGNYQIIAPSGQNLGILSTFQFGVDQRTAALTVDRYLTPGVYTMVCNNMFDMSLNFLPFNSAVSFQVGTNLQSGVPFFVEVFTNVLATANIGSFTNMPSFNADMPDYYGMIPQWSFGTSGTVINNGFMPNTGNFEYYGSRIRADFIAPSNGAYGFYIRVDDNAELWVNRNGDDPVNNDSQKTLEASQTGANGNYCNASFTAPYSPMSAFIPMVGGQRYYMETRMREGTGGDYVSIAWREQNQGPMTGGTNTCPAATEYGSNVNFGPYSFGPVSAQPVVPINVTLNENDVYTFGVSNLLGAKPFQPAVWYLNGLPAPTIVGRSFSKRIAAGDSGVVYALSNAFSASYSIWNLTVIRDLTPPTVVGVSNTAVDTLMVRYSEAVDPVSATTLANYSLSYGSIVQASLLPDNLTVVLRTSPLVSGLQYTVTINNVLDTAAAKNKIAANSQFSVTPYMVSKGFANVEVYTGLSGGNVIGTLTGSSKYGSHTPDYTCAMPAWNFRTKTNYTGLANYGIKMYGWFQPPSNGVYRFWIHSDDSSELYMNTNLFSGADKNGAVLVAQETGCCHAYDAGLGGSFSPLLTLYSNQVYYMEGHMQQGGGGEYYGMVWREMSGNPAVPPMPSYDANEVAPADEFVQLMPGNTPESIGFTLDLPAVTNIYEANRTTLALGFMATNGSPVNPALVANQHVYYQWQAKDAYGNWTNAMPVRAFSLWASNYFYPPYPGAPYWFGTDISTGYNGNSNYVGSQVLTNIAYRVVASIPGLSVTSSVCLATYIPDVSAPYVTAISANQYLNQITITFNEDLNLLSAQQINNYQIPGLTVYGVQLDPSRRKVVLSTSPQTVGGNYSATISGVRDGSANANLMGTTNISFQSWVITPFFAHIEVFTNIGGTDVPSLTNSPKYLLNVPDMDTYGPAFAFGTSPNMNYVGAAMVNYGARVSAFFTAPVDGYYRFFLLSDDSSALFMSTNMNGAASMQPSNRVMIAYNNGATNMYQTNPPMMSTNIWLTSGQNYYMEVLSKQGTGADGVAVTYRLVPDNVYIPQDIPSTVVPNVETIGRTLLSTYSDPAGATLYVTNPPPAALSVTENDYITLSMGAYVLPTNMPIVYAWQCYDRWNGIFTNIPGANSATYSFYVPWDTGTPDMPVDPTMETYQVVVYTIAHSLSAQTTLYINQDLTAPTILSLGSLDGYQIVVQMSERIRPEYAGDTFNWAVNGGATILSAQQITNTVLGVQQVWLDRILLTMDQPVSGLFSVDCYGLVDYAVAQNQGYDSRIGNVANLVGQDVGLAGNPIMPGGDYMFTNNAVDVFANGADIWGGTDGFNFIYRTISGNFDVKVRVQSLFQANVWSKAGLMARSSTNYNALNFAMLTTPLPLEGTYQLSWRPFDGSTVSYGLYSTNLGSFGSGFTPTYPNAWVRLQRLGNVFNGYYSTDGLNWVLYGGFDSTTNATGPFPPTMLVGMATLGHNNIAAGNTFAEYRDLYFPQPPVITSEPWGATNGIHAPVAFTVTALSDPGSGLVTYQWYKDGAALYGATNTVFSILNTAQADSGVYTVSVANDGGGVLSVPAILLVTNQAPIIGDLVLATNVCAWTLPASFFLNGAVDPEHDPLSLYSVAGVASVNWTANFDDGLVPAGATIYGNSTVVTTGGVSNSGCLHLTEAAANQNGSMVLNDLTPGHAVSAFTANFKLWITAGSATPADGFSLSFATNLPNGLLGTVLGAEDGDGSNLIVSWDNYNNGTAGIPSLATEAPAIDIKWGTTNVLQHVPIPVIGVSRWLPVQVVLKANGAVTVKFDGTNVVTDVPTPYASQNMLGARFGFAARTGGSYETHWVDDISITVNSAQTAAGGFVSLNGTNGTVTYTPPATGCALDSFYYFVTDGQADGSVMKQVTVQHLYAAPDSMVAASGIATNVSLAWLMSNDVNLDGGALLYNNFTQPAHGTVTIVGDVVTYTSANGYNGADTWTYSITDGAGHTASATVTVSVGTGAVVKPSYVSGSAAYDDATHQFSAQYVGGPGVTYHIQTTTDIADPASWVAAPAPNTVTADGTGKFTLIRTVNPAEVNRYYRIVP